MATVSVEMSPNEFGLVDVQNGPFAVGDVVTISGAKGTLEGRVCGLKNRVYGLQQVPGVAAMIAFTEGKISEFANGGFAGHAVKKKNGATEAKIRSPCFVKYKARLMKRTELQTMFDAAQELIGKAATVRKTDYALQWFGKAAFEGLAQTEIHRRCGELRGGVAGLAHMIFQCSPGETLGAIDTADPLRGGGSCRIKLGRGFTYDRYSWGERVCTIVHELTHWFLDTVDATMSGADCYGGECLKLARSTQKSEREKALNNADNWAYYICQYRSPGDPHDWSNFTEQEIEARGPFVSGGYNVDSSLINALG